MSKRHGRPAKEVIPHWEPAWSRHYALDRIHEFSKQGLPLNYSHLAKVEHPLFREFLKGAGSGGCASSGDQAIRPQPQGECSTSTGIVCNHPAVSRYSDFYKPYVPVAQRRLDGKKAVEKLRKKGVVIEPLGELSHRTKIATSFWGSAWCKHLESFSDYANRLPRGRTYVRNGSVLHLAIEPGEVRALVQGSELYEETITITPLAKAKWQAIQAKCKGRIGSLIELLQGKISDEIMRVVTDPEDGLFPKPSQIKLNCNCPDWATMCKHVAAVLYGIGARLDSQPELLFKLRGVDFNDLITAAADGAALDGAAGTRSGGRRRTLDSAALGDVFGIDLDADAPAPDVKPGRRAKAAKKVAKKPRPFKATPASIRKLRASLGISRAEFARRVGVSAQSIVNWETQGGSLNIRAASLERLQQIFNQGDAGK